MAQVVGDGRAVQLTYTLTIDGETIDSNIDREPLTYTHGQGELISGLERQLVGVHAGETLDIVVEPEEGYGVVDPVAFVQVMKDQLPPEVAPEVDQVLQGMGNDGQPFEARIHEVQAEHVVMDLNHPLAGKTLRFNVTVISIT